MYICTFRLMGVFTQGLGRISTAYLSKPTKIITANNVSKFLEHERKRVQIEFSYLIF